MKLKSSSKTIGLGLRDRKHAVCALGAKGSILKEESITNTRGRLAALSRRHPGALAVMEVGMQSPCEENGGHLHRTQARGAVAHAVEKRRPL